MPGRVRPFSVIARLELMTYLLTVPLAALFIFAVVIIFVNAYFIASSLGQYICRPGDMLHDLSMARLRYRHDWSSRPLWPKR